MGALQDIDLLTNCCNFLIPHIREGEESTFDYFEHGASTVAVNALRSFRVQRTVIVVGMFSLFESALQAEYGWDKPFNVVSKVLRDEGDEDTARRFDDYRLAINVLKHGEGKSLDALLARKGALEFRVKRHDEWFDEEGDIAEGQFLIDVDDAFVLNCANLIETANFSCAGSSS